MNKQGVLYIVSTPIGNLEDITLRALRVLKEVDFIASENISRTKALLNYYKIKKQVISHRRENQKKSTKKIIEIIKEGKDVALVSDAGTPGISDPGAYLVNEARQEGIKVVPVPGPSALCTAISISGLSYSEFIFLGFLPSHQKKRKRKLLQLCSFSYPIVIFESPHRLLDTLADIKEVLGNRKVLLFKELTKIHEEVKEAELETLINELKAVDVKGEYVIIVFPQDKPIKEDLQKEDFFSEMDIMLQKGLSTKDIAKYISEQKGISYREAYKKCLERKKILYGG
ncbi:MAG: 16S rRNA (cytidine(1402)-2'-O)-methyltransferase [Deltaproteobacteria bacterium]|nr:MAG: 16S rRNA (cytidine(1402)-2'-O)-methyltransferase [Deltaproteobacteria bacterium]